MNYCLSCVSVQRILVTTSSILQSIRILKSQCHMILLFIYINTLKHQSLNVKLHSKQLLTTSCIFCHVDNTLENRYPKCYGAYNRLELLHDFRFRKPYGKCTVFTVGPQGPIGRQLTANLELEQTRESNCLIKTKHFD